MSVERFVKQLVVDVAVNGSYLRPSWCDRVRKLREDAAGAAPA